MEFRSVTRERMKAETAFTVSSETDCSHPCVVNEPFVTNLAAGVQTIQANANVR